MTKIIGVIGFISSGKNCVADDLVKNHNFKKDSFAGPLKDACALIFGWPRDMLEGDTNESRQFREQVDNWWSEKLSIQNFTPRLALQLVGTDALRNNFNPDIWFLSLQNRFRKSIAENIVITDARFKNEIDYIKSHGGNLIRVIRGENPVWYETARLANSGNAAANKIMHDTYTDVHFSEWAWIGSKIDYEINNNGTLEELHAKIETVIKNIL
jgi:hypothetical protein